MLRCYAMLMMMSMIRYARYYARMMRASPEKMRALARRDDDADAACALGVAQQAARYARYDYEECFMLMVFTPTADVARGEYSAPRRCCAVLLYTPCRRCALRCCRAFVATTSLRHAAPRHTRAFTMPPMLRRDARSAPRAQICRYACYIVTP